MAYEIVRSNIPDLFLDGDLDLLKSHTARPESDWDDLTKIYTRAAVSKFEAYTRQIIVNRSVSIYSDHFLDDLPISPISSIDTVLYRSTDGDWIELSSDDYDLVWYGTSPHFELSDDANVPSISSKSKSVVFTCTAGMGSDITDIDPAIIQAIFLQVAFYLEERGDGNNNEEMHPSVKSLLNAFRRWV